MDPRTAIDHGDNCELKENQAPLPGKIAALLRESRWLILIAAAAYLALVLFTFDRADPGWSHAIGGLDIRNSGGRAGAWLADILLYVFGVSAYWWVTLLIYAVLWGYRRLDGSSISDRRPFIIALAGFVVLLVASSGVEALRFHSIKAALPLAPGGMIGSVVAQLLGSTFGFTGATLILLTLCAVSISLFTGVSWLTAAEVIGAGLEWSYCFARDRWQGWQDRKAGEIAAEKRDAVVGEKRVELIVEHQPAWRGFPPRRLSTHRA